MSKQIKMTSVDGVTLYTANKYVEDDIHVTNGLPEYNGENEGGEVVESTLKKLLDNTKRAYRLFYLYSGKNINELIEYNDTENVTDFTQTFTQTQVSEININTKNATTLTTCFQYSKLITIKLDTPNVTKINNTFNGCYDLKKIDISHYNISSTSNCSNMASSCNILKAFIIRSFGDSYVLNSNSFTDCYWLLGQTNTYTNPNGEQGYVYVPRDMISILQNETNWSTLSFRALEDYTIDGTTTGEFDDEKAGIA